MTLYYKIKDIQYNLKRKYQRAKRGYSYGDVWDMDTWFVDTIKPMLIHLRKHGCSYPMEFKDRDEWCDVLDEMVCCLEFMNEDNAECFLGFGDPDSYDHMKLEDYKQIRDIMMENKNRFFELFSKYFYDMWD